MKLLKTRVKTLEKLGGNGRVPGWRGRVQVIIERAVRKEKDDYSLKGRKLPVKGFSS